MEGGASSMTNNKTQQTDPHIQHYLQAYQQVWSVYQTNNDNYFKRTQILMFAIQVAVFAALVKLIGDIGNSNILPKSELELAALWIIPLTGFLAALAWATLITRQWNILELYRRYMRYLERVLLSKRVPLGPFTLEKAVFTEEQKCILFDSCEAINNSQVGSAGGDQEYFPDYGYRGRMRIGMMRMEEYMAVFLMSFWFSCLVTLVWYKTDNTPRCSWFAGVFISFWLLAFAFWFLVYKPLKRFLRRERKAIKRFTKFMQNE
jgi:hypothetical protein